MRKLPAFASTALGLSLFSVAAFGAGPAAPDAQLARGVSYWTDGHESRIFAAERKELFPLDVTTGKIMGYPRQTASTQSRG
jgi:hypothetical protein